MRFISSNTTHVVRPQIYLHHNLSFLKQLFFGKIVVNCNRILHLTMLVRGRIFLNTLTTRLRGRISSIIWTMPPRGMISPIIWTMPPMGWIAPSILTMPPKGRITPILLYLTRALPEGDKAPEGDTIMLATPQRCCICLM